MSLANEPSLVDIMKLIHCPLPLQKIAAGLATSLEWKCLPLLICGVLPVVSLAQSNDFSSGAARGGITAPVGDFLQLAPFKYIPPSTSVESADKPAQPEATKPETAKPKRPPEQQRIIDLTTAGDFKAAGTEGLALMAREKPDEELQLIVANSLAWTGRLKEAIPAYQALTDGKYAEEAAVGLASIHHWRGRDDLAMPFYRKALAANPQNTSALEGVEMATRELSPRTMLSFGGSKDSSDTQRRSATLNHRWRGSGGASIMEIETSAVEDSLPTVETRQQDVTFRYQSVSLALKPSLELSMPTADDRSLYASARIKLFEDQFTVEVGRVNWGRMATNPNALALHLSAIHAGLNLTKNYSFGTLTARFDYYDISDDNTVITSGVNLSSTWRPLGKNFRPFVGVETRGAKYLNANYWAPDQGSGLLYAGLIGEWGAADWNFYTSGQVGARLFGDAGTSWSLAAGGKFWVTKDIALSTTLWAMESSRNNSAYRAQAATVNLEKLWR